MTAPARASARTWIGFAIFYCVLTAAYAWPLVTSIGRAFPHDPGDPALTTWMVWWNSQAVPLTTRWWNAPIFFPLEGAFALSETLLGLAPLTTPLQWLGLGPLAAHNIAFLASFPACALAAHALAYRFTGRHDASLIAGLAFAFNPNRASQLPHIQVLWSMWMPACLLALHRYLDTRRRSYLVLAGLAWMLNALSSAYFLVFFGVLAALWMLWFARSRREWMEIGATFVVATLLVGPVFMGHHRYQSALGLSRDAEEIQSFSADLTAYWSTSSEPWLPHHWTLDPLPEGAFYPGLAVLVLAVVGAVVAWRRARQRPVGRVQAALAVVGLVVGLAAVVALVAGGWRTSLFGIAISLTRPGKALFTAALLLAAAAALDERTRAAWRRRSPFVFYAFGVVAMVLFSLGPVGAVGGTKFLYEGPYYWLMQLPGASGMRVPARFGVLALLCLAEAAAIGFAVLSSRKTGRWLTVVVAATIVAEGWVPSFPIAPLSLPESVRPGGDTSVPVLEVPMTDPYTDLEAMLRGMAHKHPVVNGFSGYEPPHYAPLYEALESGDPAAFDALRSYGPLLVVVDRSRDPDDEGAEYVASVPGAELLYQSAYGPVYRLAPVPRPAEPSLDPELPIAYVDANQNFPALPRMLDRDLGTWWQSDEEQSGGDQITIAFDGPVRLSGIELDLGTATKDYPRKLRVETADRGRAPALVWEGRTAPLAFFGALTDHVRGPVRVNLPPTVATRFTLTTMERSRERHWSIAEVRAFGVRE